MSKRYQVSGQARDGASFDVGAWDTKGGVRGGLRLFHLRIGGAVWYWIYDTRTGNGYKVVPRNGSTGLVYDDAF